MTMVISGDNGLTYPNSTTQASAGVVLQVVQGTLTGSMTTTSATFVDTGLSATITPKFSTSKILVIVSHNEIQKGNTNTNGQIQLLRTSTVIANLGGQLGFNNSNAYQSIGSVSGEYLDSPATTSATTYKTQVSVNSAGNPFYLNVTNGALSSITLMEIAQ